MNLRNHFLIAMPNMQDSLFSGSVILICDHNENGAFGLIINKPSPISIESLFSGIGLMPPLNLLNTEIIIGGPVQSDRGFIIHTPIGNWQSTYIVNDWLGVTTSRDILKSISTENQINHTMIAIGFASWQACQLEQEIARNDWLTAPINGNILFQVPIQNRYHAALAQIGIAPEQLMGVLAHA